MTYLAIFIVYMAFSINLPIDPSRTLCFTGDRNGTNPDHPNDFYGAFLPEIRRFMQFHKINSKTNHKMVNLGLGDAGRYNEVMKFMETAAKASGKAPTTLVFCCHGLLPKIQLGLKIGNVADFASRLRALHVALGTPTQEEVVIVLYACTTGSGPGPGGDNGLADKLRDALCQAGFYQCRVYAHQVSGHCTRNPRKRIFEGNGSHLGGVGGVWIIDPGSNGNVFRKWQKALAGTSLLYRFPFMTISDIHKEIDGK